MAWFEGAINLPDVTGSCARKNDATGSEFQLSTTFGGRIEESVSIFCFDFWINMIITFPLFCGHLMWSPDASMQAKWVTS